MAGGLDGRPFTPHCMFLTNLSPDIMWNRRVLNFLSNFTPTGPLRGILERESLVVFRVCRLCVWLDGVSNRI